MGTRGRRPLAGVLAFLVLGAACGGHRGAGASNPEGRPKTGAAGTPAAPWSVRVGSQGGFTGGGSGHIVRSDGTVWSWSRITPQDSTTITAAGVTGSEMVSALHAALESLAAAGTVASGSGNMTVFLEWIEAPAPRRWSWAEGTPDAKIPSSAHRAYLAALAAVADARPAH